MTPTPQQQALYQAVAGGADHLMIGAVAGSGKTTSMIEAAKLSRGRVGFVAFNKHIAQHLQAKLGSAASACTLHSLGFGALKRSFREIELDEGKAKRLLQALRPRWFIQTSKGLRAGAEAAACLELARLCKLTLTPEGDSKALGELVDHYGVDVPDPAAVYAGVMDLVPACAAETKSCDFDDMVWLPVRLGLGFPGFDTLFVDEAQDLSNCQQTLALAAAGGGRVCIVGDPHQSIMGFTGADTEAFPRLGKTLGGSPRGCRELPLTVTFRCPTSHVELARKIVPAITAAPGAIEGVVRTASVEEIRKWLQPGDLVICRKNAPVLGLAYRLLTAGVPALMRGRDVGKGLLELIDRLRPRDLHDLAVSLGDYRDRERQRLERRDAPQSMFDALEDRVTSLELLCGQCSTVAAIREFIGSLFSDRDTAEGKVVLSSVHRAKGLEAERVAILAPECLPLVRKNSKPWEIEQESNLAYVAVTRAKRELVFVGEIPTIFQ